MVCVGWVWVRAVSVGRARRPAARARTQNADAAGTAQRAAARGASLPPTMVTSIRLRAVRRSRYDVTAFDEQCLQRGRAARSSLFEGQRTAPDQNKTTSSDLSPCHIHKPPSCPPAPASAHLVAEHLVLVPMKLLLSAKGAIRAPPDKGGGEASCLSRVHRSQSSIALCCVCCASSMLLINRSMRMLLTI